MRRLRYTVFGLVVALFAASFGTASLVAQDDPGTAGRPPVPEEPLPLRIPESAPPSPEVPLPNTSSLMPENRIEWTGEVDPDLSWIGAPWDHLPPIEEEDAVPAPPTAVPQSPSPQTPPAGPTPQPPPEASAGPSPPPAPEPSSEAEGLPSPTQEPQSDPGAVDPITRPGSPVLSQTVVPLDEVAVVSLQGTGWIYVGAIPQDADIDLIESQSGAGETLFRFRPRENGDILLSFQRQDMVTGGFEESTLLLSVLQDGASLPDAVAMPDRGIVDDEELSAEQQSAPPPTRELEITTDGDGDYREARVLLAEGRREDALEAFLLHYDGAGTPELHDEIASLADDTGYEEIAHYFWELNLRLPSEEGSAARRGIAEERATAAPLRDLEEFFRLARRYDDMPSARRLFEWARLYDADGPSPDVQRALLLYGTLTEWYPGAPEAFESERRLRFLRRHFLEIR